MSSAANAARRALSRSARDTPRTMGVYAIRCNASGYTVVHASINLDGAINRHRFELRFGRHRDARLQAAWNLGGDAALAFEVLEVIRPNQEPAFDATEALDVALCLWRAELLSKGATP